MPRTLPQKLFFSLLMAALMVYGMELYNLILEVGAFSCDLLLAVFYDFLPLVAIVVILQWFIGGPLAGFSSGRSAQRRCLADYPYCFALYGMLDVPDDELCSHTAV